MDTGRQKVSDRNQRKRGGLKMAITTVKRCADCDTPKDQYGDVVCPKDGKKWGSRHKCEYEQGMFGGVGRKESAN